MFDPKESVIPQDQRLTPTDAGKESCDGSSDQPLKKRKVEEAKLASSPDFEKVTCVNGTEFRVKRFDFGYLTEEEMHDLRSALSEEKRLMR